MTSIAGHDQALPEGGKYRHRSGVTQPTPILWPPGSENPLTYPATSHPRTRGIILGGVREGVMTSIAGYGPTLPEGGEEIIGEGPGIPLF
ncbi:hypothetical protein AVEN_22084-1 [Araneus ventricosus]|uniref:Uncharacterized protein n=1 Tax=Araneus ventricosus TaxID=182803 RepID=A0A4Y2LSC2_ARAVE|nr:hypothetical protein AVEN_22084-1 [Araneus ventricosus]